MVFKAIDMEKMLLITLLIFLVIVSLFVLTSRKGYREEAGVKVWKQWGARFYYWHGVILLSSGLTLLVLFLFDWLNFF